MKYRFTDLVDLKKLKELLGSLYWMTDVAGGLLSPDGTFLFCSGWRNPCSTPAEPCECHRAIAASLNPDHFSYHQCQTGLLHYACPIVVEGDHVASVYLGQFFLTPPNDASLAIEANRLGIDVEKYQDVLRQFPVIAPMKLTMLLKYLQDLANLLADIGLQKLRQMEAMDLLQQKEDHLHYLSTHDSLTGLPNRAFFEDTMTSMQNSSILPAAIVVCDVDGLKLINDIMGHFVGDELIRAAADAVRESAPDGSVVARIGGDEFVVLLPKSSDSERSALRSRIVAKAALHNQTSPTSPLSLSVGIAVAESLPLDMRRLFQQADADMYREKVHNASTERKSGVQAFLALLRARDYGNGGHTERMITIMGRMADRLGLPQSQKNDILFFARLHDIGHVVVPELIFTKPGPLTNDERRLVERHPDVGRQIACSFQDPIQIGDWILSHHEWWNGKGYPAGMSGEEIPLPSRLLAIVAAFDAMTGERPYRTKLNIEVAFQELRKSAGTQFDPALIETVIEVIHAEQEVI